MVGTTACHGHPRLTKFQVAQFQTYAVFKQVKKTEIVTFFKRRCNFPCGNVNQMRRKRRAITQTEPCALG